MTPQYLVIGYIVCAILLACFALRLRDLWREIRRNHGKD